MQTLEKLIMLNFNNSSYWDEKYNTGSDIWSINNPVPVFVQLLEEQKFLHPSKLLIPGCGTGGEAIYAARNGYDVTVVDFSEAAISKLMEKAGKLKSNITFLNDNFFNLTKSNIENFNYIFEYVTYCSIQPEQREQFIQNMYSVLQKGGKYISLLFPIRREYSPPPFKIEMFEFLALAEKYFRIEYISNNIKSIKPRMNNEILIVMEKT